MNRHISFEPRGERARCGARLPPRRTAHVRIRRPAAGSVRLAARAAFEDWLLLPDGTWRRVETIRVRGLFG
ncbi:hypothetical protein [Streptomyces hyaluromycini]|uniref:hypothetical protein n=1 Tax=Streptomyces hyaluromycini TaxID=1377993 RepID=UPI000B5D0349|nr:hypothetical protein [Streptomyces hyaluromycini]